jgi:DnaK suppressor protein
VTGLSERLAAQEERVVALERDLAGVHAASDSSNADDEHDPEGATIAFERQLLVSLLDTARRTRDELQGAIARQESGDYGTCLVCGRPIPAARLEARPQATTCVGCS